MKNGIKSQAVIVITIMDNGDMIVRSDNGGKSMAAKMADAIVKLSAVALKSQEAAHGVPISVKRL